MIKPARWNSSTWRSAVWIFRARVKNDLALAMLNSRAEHGAALEARVGVDLVPEQAEHTPAFGLSDQLDRIDAAPERLTRRTAAPCLVQAPDLRDVSEALDAPSHLELVE